MQYTDSCLSNVIYDMHVIFLEDSTETIGKYAWREEKTHRKIGVSLKTFLSPAIYDMHVLWVEDSKETIGKYVETWWEEKTHRKIGVSLNFFI